MAIRASALIVWPMIHPSSSSTTPSPSRRALLGGGLGLAALAATRTASALGSKSAMDAPFEISLAQWSLHRTIRGGKLDNLGFPAFTKDTFGIEAVEYVNQFFKDKATDFGYLRELKQRADDAGVRSLLIMCDGEGALADEDDGRRARAIQNHFKWAAAAAFLGCHSIRVNAAGGGSWEDTQARAADSLVKLAEFSGQYGIDVIVENHGGLSSNGEWLSGVMKRANHPRVGTLPDFGNFRVSSDEMYDRYKGVEELMPFAKAVSAKSHQFDGAGSEVHTDYARMMKIVHAAGYRGWVGIEWEGGKPGEVEGIRLTQRLLERVREQLSS